MEPSREKKRKEKLEGPEIHGEEIYKLNWKQRVISGKTYSDWHKTELDGGLLLVAYVPHQYQRNKQASEQAPSRL